MSDRKKIKTCIFIHYSTSNTLPFYVKIYIKELSQHFDQINVITNNPNLEIQKDNILPSNITFLNMKNQGYDFGMFYRFIRNEDMGKYSQIALVNDSNVLINSLDKFFSWGGQNDSDFWGAIDSNEKPWFSNHENSYHIQSHFVVFNRLAIEKLSEFLKEMEVEKIMNEPDVKKLRRLVINEWEIGLTQYFLSRGLKIDSFVKSESLILKYHPKKLNVTHSLFNELIDEGYPFIKKKVMLPKKKLFRKQDESWRETILKFGNHSWDLEKIIDSVLAD